ncbi:GNAT superfamily N-acetyltransferase [Phycicoccus badiiscoriae]|uniref:GNAT superfamily N-acetyltransferase n=1 Tax=Pedococcus badiiscoriae TaxID=642776 RepID=A0A852WKI4_9MICO|nr:GNAT family N-acetyltransferase [Pedococcus badiiscoriae]NYG08131.1 GNAT superfamily N-acetyltransferase [Pedococcus badiiscoriae]
MELPDPLTARPMAPSDARAVFELVAAAETHDLGEAAIEVEDIEGDWARASFDLATESIGVWEGDRLAACGEVFKGRRADASVHPDYRGRGIGSWLADWLEDCARTRGSRLVGQTVPEGSGAEAFFQGRGYRQGWTSWVLQVPADRTIEAQPLPPGYGLRELAEPADARVAFQLIEDAFNEWPDRDPSSFDDWAPRGPLRPGFEPWQIRFVVDPAGTAVGVCFTILAGATGYVDAIAVRHDQRGLGLARALLVDAFARARAHGATVSELSTDSRTGALGLYEHVGMQVVRTWRHWMTDL